jgi:uncharacterized protein (TIGR00369 family)
MAPSDPGLLEHLRGLPKPVCAELTPFDVLEADGQRGFVRLQFEPQPLFGNHFGNIQGGFSVAMIDALLSIAVYVHTRAFLPTIEIKTSFLAPAAIGVCVGEGVVLRAGRSVVFSEARLWGPDGVLAAHATGTSARLS